MTTKRDLYVGDNLDILRRYLPAESVDLIYLDPPFKSDRHYNTLFSRHGARAAAQERAFEDTWEWNPSAEHACQVMMRSPGKVGEAIVALYRLLGEVPMMAYIAMMAPRLIELRRVLKPSGSVYLHCDPTASHYLKILMDAVFLPQQFLNEVIWKRTGTHSSARRWGPVHDVLLCYAKNRGRQVWNRPYLPLSVQHKRRHYRRVDDKGRRYELGELTGPGTRNGRSGLPWRGFDVTKIGRHWTTTIDRLDGLYAEGRVVIPDDGGWPRLVRYEDKSKGRAIGDVWEDIPPLNMKARERVGFPTQKPNALLKRIIEASSNPGDVVLDPFCGCGTAVVVSEKLGRQWIGIDITDVALDVIALRFKREVGTVPYVVKAIEPRALSEAIALAKKSRKDFETWALGLVGARPDVPHQGADRGVDARFLDVHDRPVVVSVKSGNVSAADVRDLRGVLEREGAVVGGFITLYQPTKPMLREAATAGAYEAPTGLVPRVQILTIAQLLDPNSRRLVYPPADAALTRPPSERRKEPADQFRLPLVTTVPGGRGALPSQEVPTAAPPRYAVKAGRRLSAAARGQLSIGPVEAAVPWRLAPPSRGPAKAPSRRAAAKRSAARRRRVS